MHSLLINHYLPGAWYPRGGASQIAYNMIPIIEKAGGAVLVRAPVNRILLNAANEAIGNIKLLILQVIDSHRINDVSESDLRMILIAGVSVMKGQEEVHVHAPVVISDAGIFNTYQQLLPKEVQAQAGEMDTAAM